MYRLHLRLLSEHCNSPWLNDEKLSTNLTHQVFKALKVFAAGLDSFA
jgi:hypothetical protein